MSYVPFSTSGSVKSSSPETGKTDILTYFQVIQPETYDSMYVSSFTSSGSFSLTDVHTSLDTYLIAVSTFGYMGDVALVSGLSPTYEVEVDDFQSPIGIESGTTIISSRDFEDNTVSGFNITISGYTPGQSGIINSSDLEGNYYLGLASSTDAILVASPTITGASGITCGRLIMACRCGISTGFTKSSVGFAFMRQGSDLTSSGYKVVIETGSNSNEYNIKHVVGSVLSATDITSTIGTTISTATLEFSSVPQRTVYRNIWLMVEWESTAERTLINTYHLLYEESQTIDDVKQNAVLDQQLMFTGLSDGGSFYSSTSEPILLLLGSANTSSGSVGIDVINLEILGSLPEVGLNKLDLFQRNTASGSSSVRPLPLNTIYNDGYSPEGSMNTFPTSSNPLISSNLSIYNKPGIGYSGIRVRPLGGTGTDAFFSTFKFRGSGVTDIKYGVARFIVNLGSGDSRTKVGFSFLRQGSTINSNSYTVELYRNTSNDYRVRLRKGTVYESTFGDTSDFNGTILSTSSSSSEFFDGDTFAFEIRWRALVSSVAIEVSLGSVSDDLSTFDTSPGSIDYKLVQLLTYSDSSSPYLTTTESPLFTLRGGNSIDPTLFKYELRKSKSGN